jgi:alkanesulfonate monooxygenase SsuD/methylene tetrahydromethanopterin reductase-like flavin-dependent oxidoreductase (luciferase family)
MKFAVNLPNFGYFGDARAIAELAREAEQVGWDGFFLWDHILFDDLWHPIVDPWVALTAVATHTTTIRIGTMITPIARRRPWQLTRQTVSLDRLSNGRLILGVGLGDPAQWEYGFFHEETDAQVRAQKLDEGLDILTGLWSGEYFSYVGEHYQLEEMRFLPTPVQTPRIPIWVGGYWPRKRPFRRAARFDGLCPGKIEGQLTPDDWRDVLTYIHQHRQSDTPFAAVGGGVTPGDNPAKAMDIVASFAEAGVNWWVEDISPYGRGLRWDEKWGADTAVRLRERIQQGPPKL